MTKIRLATMADVPAMIAHWERHSLENGRDGDVIFAPFEQGRKSDLGEVEEDKRGPWALSPTECGWERSWIICHGPEVFGELRLVHAPPMPATLHRALLMMGIERRLRGQGYGSQLLQMAIDWAKAQPSLEWIQLHVFENNPAAKALYRKFGFSVTGTVPDRFRVFGQKIDDTSMVLKLR